MQPLPKCLQPRDEDKGVKKVKNMKNVKTSSSTPDHQEHGVKVQKNEDLRYSNRLLPPPQKNRAMLKGLNKVNFRNLETSFIYVKDYLKKN